MDDTFSKPNLGDDNSNLNNDANSTNDSGMNSDFPNTQTSQPEPDFTIPSAPDVTPEQTFDHSVPQTNGMSNSGPSFDDQPAPQVDSQQDFGTPNPAPSFDNPTVSQADDSMTTNPLDLQQDIPQSGMDFTAVDSVGVEPNNNVPQPETSFDSEANNIPDSIPSNDAVGLESNQDFSQAVENFANSSDSNNQLNNTANIQPEAQTPDNFNPEVPTPSFGIDNNAPQEVQGSSLDATPEMPEQQDVSAVSGQFDQQPAPMPEQAPVMPQQDNMQSDNMMGVDQGATFPQQPEAPQFPTNPPQITDEQFNPAATEVKPTQNTNPLLIVGLAAGLIVIVAIVVIIFLLL